MQFSFKERLEWIGKNHYKKSNEVVVEEKEEQGRAEVVFRSDNELMYISLSRNNSLKYINYNEVADGTVVEFLDESSVNLHVVECKKTITEQKWEKVKRQLKGGLVNSFGLCGLLNKSISKVVFYTAFREDKLDSINTTNPVLLKATIGTKQKTSAIDWNSSKVSILNKDFEHIKIKLDSDGLGRYSV